MSKDKVFSVFVPNDTPTVTYISRPSINNEEKISDGLQTPNMVISISGPSKTGKTALVNKCVEADNIIMISGSSVGSAESLWKSVMRWIGGADEVSNMRGQSTTGSVSGNLKGSANIIVANGEADLGGGVSHERQTSTTETYTKDFFEEVVREIASSDFMVFVDDFHYMDRSIQSEVARSIKAISERGVRVCVASVPYRSDDVVRANGELSGRLVVIDFDYWAQHDLQRIANAGFDELKVDIAPTVAQKLARESLGSPQLMQSLCLNLCLEAGIRNDVHSETRFQISDEVISRALERTSQSTDYSTLTKQLHAGAKQRGTQRKEFDLADGSSGDVYRSILLALVQDPPRLSFSYEEIVSRVNSVCSESSPTGSSVSESLSQMGAIAKSLAGENDASLVWEEENLEVTSPYFMFYLRASDKLGEIYRARSGM